MTLALLVLSLAVFVGAVMLYTRLVRDQKLVQAAWSDIGVQLKRRHDLVPKLVDAVRAYASYESQRLEELTRLRAAAERAIAPGEAAGVERDLGRGIVQLIAVAEAYPDLKASEQFLTLLRELSDVEDQIQYARRFYNGAVKQYRDRLESFPHVLVARTFAFQPLPFFETDDRDPVKVQL